jgi:hypothetical protein
VRCPECHQRYAQPIRTEAATSRTVAKREACPPEFVTICPHCSTLAIVAFFPAGATVPS